MTWIGVIKLSWILLKNPSRVCLWPLTGHGILSIPMPSIGGVGKLWPRNIPVILQVWLRGFNHDYSVLVKFGWERNVSFLFGSKYGRTRYNEALKNKYGDLNGDIFNDGWICHSDNGFVIKVRNYCLWLVRPLSLY